MKLDFALLSDEAVDTGDGKVDLRGGGIDHVISADVPFRVERLFFVARVIAEADEPREEHTVQFRMLLPGGGPGAAATAHVPAMIQPGDRRHGVAALVFVIELSGITFPAYGPHEMQFLIDGELIASKIISALPEGEVEQVLRSTSS